MQSIFHLLKSVDPDPVAVNIVTPVWIRVRDLFNPVNVCAWVSISLTMLTFTTRASHTRSLSHRCDYFSRLTIVMNLLSQARNIILVSIWVIDFLDFHQMSSSKHSCFNRQVDSCDVLLIVYNLTRTICRNQIIFVFTLLPSINYATLKIRRPIIDDKPMQKYFNVNDYCMTMLLVHFWKHNVYYKCRH